MVENKIVLNVLIILFIIIVGGVVFLVVDAVYRGVALNEACERIGMENYYRNGESYCVENGVEAHYVKFDCEGFLKNIKCNAILISIGDVRTVGVE